MYIKCADQLLSSVTPTDLAFSAHFDLFWTGTILDKSAKLLSKIGKISSTNEAADATDQGKQCPPFPLGSVVVSVKMICGWVVVQDHQEGLL